MSAIGGPGGAVAIADRVLSQTPLAGRVRRDVPLGPMTTYRVGGAAARMVVVESRAELAQVAEAVQASELPVLVVGRGSNLLVSDRGFGGLAVALGPGLAEVRVHGELVEMGGAASLPTVARRTAGLGLRGFEWAVGVPGSVGGAVRMNAGGHGSDLAAVLMDAEVMDLRSGRVERLDVARLELGYRRSALRDDQVVLAATIRLSPGDRAEAAREIDEVVRWRRQHQPGGHNAGSVFTNPPGDAAGRLIEQAGCKGLRLGSATVSGKHANFFQADEGGSADDVYRLMREVQVRVRRCCGVSLVAETRLVGFDHVGRHDGDATTGGAERP